MTVREYRTGDWVGVADLWRRNPSREFPLLGLDPDGVGAVLRKAEGFGIRFLLGVARLFGRPILEVLIVDLGGRVMGTTLLNFTPEGAYVSGVVVDASVRRQGLAQAMLRTGDALCRKYHRRQVVLDVLAGNDPAIRLYDRLGYEPLRDQVWLTRDFGPQAPLPAVTGTTRVRPCAKGDGARLAELDNALMPTEVREVIPRHAGEFHLSGITRSVLQSETRDWVAEVDGQPVGFLRATVSQLMQAANLTSPLFGRDVTDPVVRDLFITALHWVEEKKPPRVLTEVPEHQWGRRPILDALGFVEHFRSHTLVHRLGA